MNELKQVQKGGDNLVQNQIGTQIVVGIDEKRVREICDEKIALALADYSLEGKNVARQRIDVLTAKVIARIKDDPKNIRAFSDPSFQRNVIWAQISAAESDRESDIETLAELLVARMRGNLKRSTRTGIRRAIEIVPEVEGDELVALSVLLLNTRYFQKSTYALNVDQFLTGLNDTLRTVVAPIGLPHGTRWLQHLSILDCVEVNHVNSFKKLEDWYSEIYAGIVCVGIKMDTEEFSHAQKALNECGIGSDMMVQNDLLPGYARLPTACLWDLSILPVRIPNAPIGYTMIPNAKHQEGLKAVLRLYSQDSHLMQKAKEVFAKKMSDYEVLKKVKSWLDGLRHNSFTLTNIGEALAYVHAKQCIPNLPEIVLE